MRTPAFIVAVAALVLQAGAALAHAALVSSDPADGAVLAAAPSRIVLTFDEPVSPILLRLIDDKGYAMALSYRLADTAVIVDRPGAVGSGSHALSWRVISADGHPVGGTVVFSVGAPSRGVVPGAEETVDWPLRIAIWACRLAIYVAFVAGIGGTFFATLIARDRSLARRTRLAGLAAGLVAVPISIGLQGLDALDLPLGAIANPLAWQMALRTTWTATAIIAVFALLAALAATLCAAAAGARVLSALALAGVGAALAVSGHASAAQPQLLMRPAVFIHATAITFWIGALLPLAFALRQEGGARVLVRFSQTISFVLVLLVLAGTTLAVVQVETPAGLSTTDYGHILLFKLALVAVLLLLAAINRWRLTSGAEAGDRTAIRRLVGAIFLEATLATAILGTVAMWRFTPPPRALEAAAAGPVSVHIHTAQAMADVTLTPGHVGPVVASIYVQSGDFGPLAAKEVTLTLSNPSAGIEPIKRPAKKLGDGSWSADDLVIPVAGRWQVEVAVLISEFELVRLRGTMDVRR